MERKRGTTGKVTNGRIIDSLRKHAKLTHQELAEQVGLNSAQHMQRICAGKIPIPTHIIPDRIVDMAMRFNPEPLNHARKIRGLTLADLAKRINKSQATVSMVLAGKVCAVKTVFALCAELGVPTAKVWR